MNLNMSNWGSFHISDILCIMNGKGITAEEIEENAGNFVAVQSGEDNNGCLGKIDLEYCKSMGYTYTEKSCLTVARTGSAGYVSFQINGCVVGDSAKILLLPDTIASPERYMFLQALLSANRYKYSYGRKVTEDKYMNEYIDLPVDENGQPDWSFITDYMKSLHHKPLTTENVNSSIEINVKEWKNFALSDLFSIVRGDRIVRDIDYSDNKDDINCFPVITTTMNNNGVDGFYSQTNCDGNCLISAGEASGMFTTYQESPCWALDTVRIYTPIGFTMNKHRAIFLASLLTKEMYKFSYGRKAKPSNMYTIDLKLPVTKEGNPDWEFMENYIKSLPYGDRL